MKAVMSIFFFMMLFRNVVFAQSQQKIILNKNEFHSGYYLAVQPETDTIKGVLVLLAGFGQLAEDIFAETDLENLASQHQILTVAFAGGNKLYADSITRHNLSAVLRDVIQRYNVSNQNFVFGGFSAGGMIALRYVELCNEFPEMFPVKPKGVFTVDSPIDIFTIYEQLEQSLRDNYSDLAAEEATRAIRYINEDYGVPRDNIDTYSGLTAFSMNKAYGENEKYLLQTAVRVYHDVDIAWRLINRNQTVHNSNYEVTAELINRLLLMGHRRAEFMQSFRTGYRSNGQRHPHSWSIVDGPDCIRWMKNLLE